MGLQDRDWYREEKRTQNRKPTGGFKPPRLSSDSRGRALRTVLLVLGVVLMYEYLVRPYIFG